MPRNLCISSWDLIVLCLPVFCLSHEWYCTLVEGNRYGWLTKLQALLSNQTRFVCLEDDVEQLPWLCLALYLSWCVHLWFLTAWKPWGNFSPLTLELLHTCAFGPNSVDICSGHLLGRSLMVDGLASLSWCKTRCLCLFGFLFVFFLEICCNRNSDFELIWFWTDLRNLWVNVSKKTQAAFTI